MKKLLTLALVLMLALSLAACGAKGNNNSNNNNAANNPSQAQGDYATLDIDKDMRKSDLEITALQIGKAKYSPDKPITVYVEWNGTPDDSAWIGIIPADVPHGDEETNDGYDIDFCYLRDTASGSEIVFETSLEPGKYTMRINEADDGGAELAWCAFEIK